MSRPIVDIGMPSHGRPLFIAEAVESVLAQTESRWSLVVLDDPGGGETEDILTGPARDPRVHYRGTGTSVTAPEAMTELMSMGQAPYFAFLHDDDRWGPRFLERRVEFLERNPACGLVFSGHVDIDGSGTVTARHPLDFPEGPLEPGALFPRFAFQNLVDTMHSVVVRRSALEDAGAYVDPGFPRVFDWELWLRLALRVPVGFVRGEEDVQYRVHGDQMSGSLGAAEDFLAIFDRADAEIEARFPELRAEERRRRRHRAGLLLSVALDRVQRGEQRGAASALVEAVRAWPASAFHRRFLAALAALAAGRRGRRALEGARQRLYRRRAGAA